MASLSYVEYPDGDVIATDSPHMFTGGKIIKPATEGKRRYMEKCRAQLLELLAPGDRVYTCLRHVSASGMSQRISAHLALADSSQPQPYIRDITRLVADLAGFRVHPERNELIVGGAGMDMGFHVVYTLGYMLWPNGTPTPHGTRNGVLDSNGGYALKQQWL